jgi:hypothetical protein
MATAYVKTWSDGLRTWELYFNGLYHTSFPFLDIDVMIQLAKDQGYPYVAVYH